MKGGPVPKRKARTLRFGLRTERAKCYGSDCASRDRCGGVEGVPGVCKTGEVETVRFSDEVGWENRKRDSTQRAKRRSRSGVARFTGRTAATSGCLVGQWGAVAQVETPRGSGADIGRIARSRRRLLAGGTSSLKHRCCQHNGGDPLHACHVARVHIVQYSVVSTEHRSEESGKKGTPRFSTSFLHLFRISLTLPYLLL